MSVLAARAARAARVLEARAARADRIMTLLAQHPGRAYTATELSAALGDLTPHQCRVAADRLVEDGRATRRPSPRAEVRRSSSEYLQEVPA